MIIVEAATLERQRTRPYLSTVQATVNTAILGSYALLAVVNPCCSALCLFTDPSGQ